MDKNNNTLSEVRKTAAQRMWDAENKQRAKSDASNKRTPSSIPVSDKKMKTEGATGAKPGWMLRQDPVLGSRVKAAQAKQKEFKKLVGTKVPVKPTPTKGVEEEASPMIKPPSNRFDNKKEAFTHAKTHGGKVFRSTYINPNTGDKNITFVVKKEQNVAEARDPREYDYEGDMAKSQLRSIIANAQRAHDMLEDDTNMAEWVQSKITLAADYISTVADYMQSEVNEEAHIVSPLSAANANAEYKRQPSNTLKVDVKHLGGVSNHKAIKQHLISKGITAGIGSSDNYNTVHLSNISHSHGEIKKKLGIKEAIIEAHTEDDIANGGTVIYKHDGKHYMAKVSHKTGGGAGTMIHTTSNLGHKIKLNQVVSTDASDWTKFKNIKEEAKKGLYYYVNKRKEAGTSRSKNHPDAPSAQDWKDAAKTAKEEVDLSELNKDTVISYAIRANKDQDKQSTAIGKGIRNNDPKSANKASHKFSKRAAGLDRVETRLNKESKSFLDIRKELDERNLTPVEKIAREELSKMKYKKVRGAPTE